MHVPTIEKVSLTGAATRFSYRHPDIQAQEQGPELNIAASSRSSQLRRLRVQVRGDALDVGFILNGSETGPSSPRLSSPRAFPGPSSCRAPARNPADLLSINYDVLPNIYAPKIVHGAKSLGVLPLLPSRSLATRLAACWAAILVVSGCSTTPIATPLTTVSQPRLASGQPVSLEQTYAYDGGPTGAVPLPSPSSQAVAVMDGGSGSMIGGHVFGSGRPPAQMGTWFSIWRAFRFSRPPRPFSAT